MLSKSKGSARACRKEGDIEIFGFCGFGNFLDRFFGFCAKRLTVFRFCCSFRFTDFSFFTIRFSYKIIAVFRFYYPMLFLGFPILRVSEVFGFGRIFWQFWMIFSSVLRFLILYTPMSPSVSNEEHSMMSSDWLRVALLLHALWHGKKRS